MKWKAKWTSSPLCTQSVHQSLSRQRHRFFLKNSVCLLGYSRWISKKHQAEPQVHNHPLNAQETLPHDHGREILSVECSQSKNYLRNRCQSIAVSAPIWSGLSSGRWMSKLIWTTKYWNHSFQKLSNLVSTKGLVHIKKGTTQVKRNPQKTGNQTNSPQNGRL